MHDRIYKEQHAGITLLNLVQSRAAASSVSSGLPYSWDEREIRELIDEIELFVTNRVHWAQTKNLVGVVFNTVLSRCLHFLEFKHGLNPPVALALGYNSDYSSGPLEVWFQGGRSPLLC